MQGVGSVWILPGSDLREKNRIRIRHARKKLDPDPTFVEKTGSLSDLRGKTGAESDFKKPDPDPTFEEKTGS